MALKHKFRNPSAQASSMYGSGSDASGEDSRAGLSTPARLRIILALSLAVWGLASLAGWMLYAAIR
jgi:hypothetical protein